MPLSADPDRVLPLLADLHARILELRERGLDETDMAIELGIEPASVRPLLEIASAKLAALRSLLAVADPHDDAVSTQEQR